LLSAIIVVLAETIGLWFVMNKLVIPPERLNAASWIYQAAVVSFLQTLITTPYMASIIAHENMNIYAYVSIIEAVLKLAIVFLLQVLSFDKLVLYGLLLMTVSFINTTIYRIYCKKHYKKYSELLMRLWFKGNFYEEGDMECLTVKR
jgi:O-antigen/teichoic acid export membrane protein